MSNIEALKSDSLTNSSASPGITRDLAFKGDGFMIVRSRSDPGVISGWHHHGDYDVYGFLVSGSARLETDGSNKKEVELTPGDFVHVPAHTVHREINPSRESRNEFILYLYGSGPLVTNVEM